jgi:hypothetical protein
LVANNVQTGAKIMPFHKRNPTEMPYFVSKLRNTVKTAKPLCAGSIPARTSNTSQQLTTIGDQRLHPLVANMVANWRFKRLQSPAWAAAVAEH